jgi:hypothetical protein
MSSGACDAASGSRMSRTPSTPATGRTTRRPPSGFWDGAMFTREPSAARPSPTSRICLPGRRARRAAPPGICALPRYGELQNSLFFALARPLGMAGAGGRDAFGDLFQIADRRVGSGTRRRADPPSARLSATGDRQPAQDAAAHRAPPPRHVLRGSRRHGRRLRRAADRLDRRSWTHRQRAGRAPRGRRESSRTSSRPSSGGPASFGRCATSRDARPTRSAAALGITHRQYAGCSSGPTPRSTASCWPTSPATGVPAMRRGSRGWPRTGRRRPRPRTRASTSTPARVAAPRNETFTRLHPNGA